MLTLTLLCNKSATTCQITLTRSQTLQAQFYPSYATRKQTRPFELHFPFQRKSCIRLVFKMKSFRTPSFPHLQVTLVNLLRMQDLTCAMLGVLHLLQINGFNLIWVEFWLYRRLPRRGDMEEHLTIWSPLIISHMRILLLRSIIFSTRMVRER